MSFKFDVMLEILNKLARGEQVTVQGLSEEFEVTTRTVYRYIQTLVTAKFPVVFDRSRNSYVFEEGYSLVRPNVSVEETLAFAIAKKLLGSFGSGMEKSLSSLEEKLSMKRPALSGNVVLAPEKLPETVGPYLGTIHHAMQNFQRIEIGYRTLFGDEETKRQVEPCYIFFQDGFWNLRAYCRLRQDYRTFALDRIQSLKVLDEHFVPHNLDGIDELTGTFGAFVDGEKADVVLVFDRETAPHISRKKWHQSQAEKTLPDGRLEVRFTINNVKGIKRWVYQWIPGVEVREPKELREAFEADLRRALRRRRAASS